MASIMRWAPVRRLRAWRRRRGRFGRWKQRESQQVELLGWDRVGETILANERRRMIERRRSEGRALEGHPGPRAGDTAGLAISGGGIRSATFSLGVLQALAASRLLNRFDYLSTVSGGGYLGSSLTWMLNQDSLPPEINAQHLGLDPERFPFGTEDPEPPPGSTRARSDEPWQRKLLRYLREHGNYLTPDRDITLLSGLSVLLRGLIINLVVWIPISAIALFAAEKAADGGRSLAGLTTAEHDPLVDYLWLGAALLGAFAALSVLYGFFTMLKRRKWGPFGRYQMRRAVERWSGVVLKLAAGLVVVGSLPVVAADVTTAAFGGGTSVVLGFLSGAVTFFQAGNKESKLPLSLTATLGSALLLYGLALLAYALLAYALRDALASRAVWAFALVTVAFVVGWRSNLNYISLHRFYRDRLMETFVPELDRALENETGPSNEGDAALLSEMGKRGPYHLINTHLILVDSSRPKLRRRGGDSFLLSPAYCGSDATGYLRTESFARNSIGLATAMAISGAAANPNTGVGGVGPTRQSGVALLMSLLNVRLGYWVPHPQWSTQRSRTPSHFRAMWYQLSSKGYAETSRNLEISDGGHFENLGLYELVRRRCGFILAIDGGADPGFSFEDLRNAGERISEDLDARVEFETGALEAVIPDEKRQDPIARAPLASRGYALGTIHYGSPGSTDYRTALLVYVKSTLIAGASLRVRGYRRGNDTFPHQSTADQFFGEDQFEAYRRLGYDIGEQVARQVPRRMPPGAPWYQDPTT